MIDLDFPTVSGWVQQRTGCLIPISGAQAIGWERNGKIVAGVIYEHFTGASVAATIAIEEGVMVPKEFLRVIFDYPFRQLGCRKILAYVENTNSRSLNMLEKMGFGVEGVIRDVYPSGPMIICAVTPETCRYFGERHGKKIEDSCRA